MEKVRPTLVSRTVKEQNRTELNRYADDMQVYISTSLVEALQNGTIVG